MGETKVEKGSKINSVLTWEVTEIPEHEDDWIEFSSKDLGIEVWLQYRNGLIIYSAEKDLIQRGNFTCKSLKDGIFKVEKDLLDDFIQLKDIADEYVKRYNSQYVVSANIKSNEICKPNF